MTAPAQSITGVGETLSVEQLLSASPVDYWDRIVAEVEAAGKGWRHAMLLNHQAAHLLAWATIARDAALLRRHTSEGGEGMARDDADYAEYMRLVEECIALEPELPEEPTPETLALIEADPLTACRVSVRLTKRGILDRLHTRSLARKAEGLASVSPSGKAASTSSPPVVPLQRETEE